MASEPSLNPEPRDFRWQAYLQRSSDPLYLLDRHRRIRFVNRAWEKLTGLSLAQARGLVCTRRESATALARSLCPPPEALAGQACRVRRLFPGTKAGPPWWDVEFFPLQGSGGLLGLLGRVSIALSSPAVGARSLPETLGALREQAAQRFTFDTLASATPAMRRVEDQVRLACQTAFPVTLLGEAGAGKRWLARIIHHQGPTADRHFIEVDCAHLTPLVLGQMLGGDHAVLHRTSLGTLYLRQPQHLPRELQQRLAEWIGERETGARVVTGFRADPLADVRSGRLLEAFQVAISPLTIALPPLRERRDDLPALVDRLLRRRATLHPMPAKGLTSAAWEMLHAYAWPGNLRELDLVLASAITHAKGDALDAGDLPAYLRRLIHLEPEGSPDRRLPLDQLLEQVERRLILLALRKSGGNQAEAADLLEVWRARLGRRIKALGIKAREA